MDAPLSSFIFHVPKVLWPQRGCIDASEMSHSPSRSDYSHLICCLFSDCKIQMTVCCHLGWGQDYVAAITKAAEGHRPNRKNRNSLDLTNTQRISDGLCSSHQLYGVLLASFHSWFVCTASCDLVSLLSSASCPAGNCFTESLIFPSRDGGDQSRANREWESCYRRT